MALLNNLGKLLAGSEWTDILNEAGVLTSGRANSVLHGSHVKRACRIHEVSAVCFTKLKANAYANSKTDKSFVDWNEEQCSNSPTFFFWDLILRIQLWILTFVRSIRERKIELYINILAKVNPSVFCPGFRQLCKMDPGAC